MDVEGVRVPSIQPALADQIERHHVADRQNHRLLEQHRLGARQRRQAFGSGGTQRARHRAVVLAIEVGGVVQVARARPHLQEGERIGEVAHPGLVREGEVAGPDFLDQVAVGKFLHRHLHAELRLPRFLHDLGHAHRHAAGRDLDVDRRQAPAAGVTGLAEQLQAAADVLFADADHLGVVGDVGHQRIARKVGRLGVANLVPRQQQGEAVAHPFVVERLAVAAEVEVGGGEQRIGDHVGPQLGGVGPVVRPVDLALQELAGDLLRIVVEAHDYPVQLHLGTAPVVLVALQEHLPVAPRRHPERPVADELAGAVPVEGADVAGVDGGEAVVGQYLQEVVGRLGQLHLQHAVAERADADPVGVGQVAGAVLRHAFDDVEQKRVFGGGAGIEDAQPRLAEVLGVQRIAVREAGVGAQMEGVGAAVAGNLPPFRLPGHRVEGDRIVRHQALVHRGEQLRLGGGEGVQRIEGELLRRVGHHQRALARAVGLRRELRRRDHAQQEQRAGGRGAAQVSHQRRKNASSGLRPMRNQTYRKPATRPPRWVRWETPGAKPVMVPITAMAANISTASGARNGTNQA